jgi:hypothetical protein
VNDQNLTVVFAGTATDPTDPILRVPELGRVACVPIASEVLKVNQSSSAVTVGTKRGASLSCKDTFQVVTSGEERIVAMPATHTSLQNQTTILSQKPLVTVWDIFIDIKVI